MTVDSRSHLFDFFFVFVVFFSMLSLVKRAPIDPWSMTPDIVLLVFLALLNPKC